MKTLLHPAISLMNRLSFGMKFSLISVLFFLPMLATNYFLIRDAYNQFVGTKTELAGLELLAGSLKVRRGMENLENLARLQVQVGVGNQSEDLNNRISDQELSLIDELERLTAVALTVAQVDDINAKRDALVEWLRAAHADTTQAKQQHETKQQLDNVQILVASVISSTGLSLDPNPSERKLINLIAEYGNDVTLALAESRSIGANLLATGSRSSDAIIKVENALQLLDKLQSEYGQHIDGALVDDEKARTILQAKGYMSRDSLTAVGTLLDSNLMQGSGDHVPWQKFFDQMSVEIDKTYQFNDATLSYIGGELRQQLVGDQQRMLLLVSGLLLVFLLIGYLYSGFYVAVRSTLKSFSLVMDDVAAGDMTVNIKTQSQDELGELGGVINGTIGKVHQLIQRVGQTVVKVECQADRVEVVSNESSQAVADQRQQIELIATAMNQLTATAQEVARNAAVAVESAHSVNKETISGRTLVESQVDSIQQLAGEIDQSVVVINQLASDSSTISQVLDVIKAIAEQTNLLALNAAIEAARAGEQGRGFAVVADEVRNLAKRTQSSTQEIEQTISKLQNGVSAAVKVMNASHSMASSTASQSRQVQQALENIFEAVGTIVDQNQQIAAAAQEQTAVTHDIDSNIVQINQAGNLTAKGASQTEQASRELSELVGELKELIGAFRV
ncbi:methyl-accepting chemotaxis protein [Pseudomonas sp. GM21]|nr:methyl-accepting chemotaxis protein [Pseudomonas sp. GM21]EJM24320.1 methyl-accepting chemotaxis protein [Pseudomonas sp. GM21]